jgi:hypothetical protein
MEAKEPKAPPLGRLLANIRKLATEPSNVLLSDHAQERMWERDILDIDVFRILRSGRLMGEIEAGKRRDEWKVKIVDMIRGRREAGVVTVVIGETRLFVVTVEWEDPT